MRVLQTHEKQEEKTEIDQRRKKVSRSLLGKHATTRQRTLKNLLLHLGCDVFSLSHSPTLGLCVLVCVFPCACVRACVRVREGENTGKDALVHTGSAM